MAATRASQNLNAGRPKFRIGSMLLLVALIVTAATLVLTDRDPSNCPEGTTLMTSTGDPGNRLGPTIERACVKN